MQPELVETSQNTLDKEQLAEIVKKRIELSRARLQINELAVGLDRCVFEAISSLGLDPDTHGIDLATGRVGIKAPQPQPQPK